MTRFIALNLLIMVILSYSCVFATEPLKTLPNEKCATINPKEEIHSVWYVPTDQQKVHFVALPKNESEKKYVIKGDLIIASTGTPNFICGNYIRKGKVVAAGWLKKSEIERFELVSFGAFDAQESQKKIPQANRALISLSKRLPEIKDWRGTYQDKYGNNVNIWKKGLSWQLNTTGIIGSIGTGDKEEDSQTLIIYGARAEYRHNKAKYDVCDIVIIGFNNAILATNGSHCMGSGANHEYPEFSGLYWKQ